MNIQQVTHFIESIISQSIDGQDIENVKVECKSQWWDLKTIPGLNEFLKDTCAIANTFGLDGFIIIGFDDKTKVFKTATFSDSGFSDSSEIRNVLIKNVDSVFDLNTFDINYDGNKLSILHIPPSVDKPHVLKVYKKIVNNNVKEELNKIFVRKNSSNYIASKNDIDIMYYDRKNIIPEYKLLVSIEKNSMGITGSSMGEIYNEMKINPVLIFENLGSRPLAIVNIELRFSAFVDPAPNEEFVFKIKTGDPILIPINEIVHNRRAFEPIINIPRSTEEVNKINNNKKNIYLRDIVLTTNSGKVITESIFAY